MISLKQKIARANVGISDKLAELSEVKAMLSHLKTIPAKEGKQVESYSEDYVLVAEIKKAELTAEMDAVTEQVLMLDPEVSTTRHFQIYHTGNCIMFSRNIPGCGQLQMTAPIPRFLFSSLSNTMNADVSVTEIFEFCFISIG